MNNGRRTVGRLIAVAIITCVCFFSAPDLLAGQDYPSGQEGIPFKRQNTPPADSIARVLIVSLLTAGAVAGAGILLRRNLQKKGMFGLAGGKRIILHERKRLSSKVTLFLLAVDDQEYLLVQGGDQIEIIKHAKTETET